jgi:DNA-binding MarR family transcriptional regulator
MHMAPSMTPDDRLTLDQQVCFNLAVAARDVIALYRPLLEPLGLTHPQYLVLLALWQHPGPLPLCVKDLSGLLKTEPPTLSPVLKRLETAGLVTRRRDPTDQRSVLIRLTPLGQALRSQAASVPTTLMDRLGMDIEELESLQKMLIRVIQHANAPTPPSFEDYRPSTTDTDTPTRRARGFDQHP